MARRIPIALPARPRGSGGGALAVAAASALAAVAIVTGGAAPAEASQTLYCPDGQYCAWEDDLRQGHIFNHVASLGYVGDGWNDRFSSLENRRRDAVVFYEHDYGGGDGRVVGRGEVAKQLQFEWTEQGRVWNDRITSVTAY